MLIPGVQWSRGLLWLKPMGRAGNPLLPPTPCKTPADQLTPCHHHHHPTTHPQHLFQCPRVNGIKAHTDQRNRRQVVLDLQIW